MIIKLTVDVEEALFDACTKAVSESMTCPFSGRWTPQHLRQRSEAYNFCIDHFFTDGLLTLIFDTEEGTCEIDI